MVKILDQHGNPIKKQELVKEVAAPSIAGVRNVWHGAVGGGLTPSRLASMLRSAQEGDVLEYLTLAEEMEEKEFHYRSVLSTGRSR